MASQPNDGTWVEVELAPKPVIITTHPNEMAALRATNRTPNAAVRVNHGERIEEALARLEREAATPASRSSSRSRAAAAEPAVLPGEVTETGA